MQILTESTIKNMENEKFIVISKYNEKNYDENHKYLLKDWTSISDIGKVWMGEFLSKEKYMEVEDNYVEAVVDFFEWHNCFDFKFTRVRKLGYSDNDLFGEGVRLKNFYDQFIEDMSLSKDDLRDSIRLALRGDLDVEIGCKNNMRLKINFGYDYYMYFYSPFDINDMQDLKAIINERNLFVNGK